MNCELCHKADAVCAITRTVNGVEEELYVCSACSRNEQLRHQKESQRTRKEEVEELPSHLRELISAIDDMVDRFCQEEGQNESSAPNRDLQRLPTERVGTTYRIRGLLHLEGLHLLGELDAVKRALEALRMELRPLEADGIHDIAHAYAVYYEGSSEQAKRVVADILREEGNARQRLMSEMPRVMSDAICRALAILKNCRMISSGELVDILSPLRLATLKGLLEGITRKEVEELMAVQDLTNSEDKLPQEERDRVDADRADEMNRRFEGVLFDDIV